MVLGIKNGLAKSEELYARACKVIPGGHQTFSRSPMVFPNGAAPKYIVKEKGSHVWDVDGNEYIDMVASCGPVTLGYNFAPVDEAIKKQLDMGIVYSTMTPLEVEVAEKLVEVIPCAEMVRFSKNGSDVCAAAIKIARASTGRDLVLCWGYHGFQDWYIGTTDRNGGIPEAVRALTKTFDYNDAEGLKRLLQENKGRVAAVIMEPVIAEKPKAGFLEQVKQLAHENGALLIFDEMITGFRFAMGGAQEYFGVTPDLAAFGKGITNGMPLGVLAGKKELMARLESDVFLSSTYASEALTLAAASTVIDFYKSHKVIDDLWKKGTFLQENFAMILKEYDLGEYMSLAGYPVRQMINLHERDGIQNYKLASLYQQEMIAQGVLCWAGLTNFSYSHSEDDLKYVVKAFNNTCKIIKDAVTKRDIDAFLRCKVSKPVFKGLRERNKVSN